MKKRTYAAPAVKGLIWSYFFFSVQRGGPQMAAVKDAMDRVAGNNPPTVKIAAPVA